MGRDELQSVAEYLGLTLVFVCVCVGGGVWGAPLGGGFNCHFSERFFSYWQNFHFSGEGWVLGYHSMGFRHFPNAS